MKNYAVESPDNQYLCTASVKLEVVMNGQQLDLLPPPIRLLLTIEPVLD